MIYFIQDTGTNSIKIGVSKKPLARLAELQTGSASTLILLGVADGMQKQERELHTRFKRKQGEWFEPTPDLLEYIRKHAVTPASLSQPHTAPAPAPPVVPDVSPAQPAAIVQFRPRRLPLRRPLYEVYDQPIRPPVQIVVPETAAPPLPVVQIAPRVRRASWKTWLVGIALAVLLILLTQPFAQGLPSAWAPRPASISGEAHPIGGAK